MSKRWVILIIRIQRPEGLRLTYGVLQKTSGAVRCRINQTWLLLNIKTSNMVSPLSLCSDYLTTLHYNVQHLT